MKLSIFCPFGSKTPIHAPKIGSVCLCVGHVRLCVCVCSGDGVRGFATALSRHRPLHSRYLLLRRRQRLWRHVRRTARRLSYAARSLSSLHCYTRPFATHDRRCVIRYDTIRDAILISVQSKADMSQFNLPHATNY